MDDDFPSRLRAWREAAGISRAQLENELTSARRNPSSTGNYIAMLENGRHKPPDRGVCEVIAAKLDLPADEVWTASARARMAAVGVLDFHDEVIGRTAEAARAVASGKLNEREQDLIEWLRDVDRAWGFDFPPSAGASAETLRQLLMSGDVHRDARRLDRLGNVVAVVPWGVLDPAVEAAVVMLDATAAAFLAGCSSGVELANGQE
jgi:transcriptional regulator with XRE-family HTH domain